jgi:hypothetical protein
MLPFMALLALNVHVNTTACCREPLWAGTTTIG